MRSPVIESKYLQQQDMFLTTVMPLIAGRIGDKMPCGGIWKVANRADRKFHEGGRCFQCNKPFDNSETLYFVSEWDAVVHGSCIHAFLLSDEGKTVLEHKHMIFIEEGGS